MSNQKKVKMKNSSILKFGLLLMLTLTALTAYGQSSGYAKSGDVKIHFRDYGKGTPIVLLSGGPGFSSDDLLPLVERLKDRYRLILVDQRGTGKSKLEIVDNSTITLDNYVEDINNVRKHLAIENWIVVGHSWGGGLAMALTAKYPKNTSKLILIGSMGIDTEFLKYVQDNLRYSKEDIDNLSYWSNPTVAASNPARASYEKYRSLLPSRVYDPSSVGKIMQHFKYEPNGFKIGGLMFPHLIQTNYDLKPQLSKFQNPTLIIQGRQGFLGGWTAFKILRTIPKCEIEFIEKCGHFPFVEKPEEFFKILTKFLGQ